MAKRFGRNQKRRMREKITKLEKEVTHKSAYIQNLRQENKELKEQLETIVDDIQRICKYSAVLPAKKKRVTESFATSSEIWIDQPDIIENFTDVYAKQIVHNRMALPFVRSFLRVKENIATFKKFVHLEVWWGNKVSEMAYAVSEHTLKVFPENVTEYIWSEIQNMIPRVIKQLTGRRP